MAFSFAHYCPHCRVPSEVYVNEPDLPQGSNSFNYQCPRCQHAVSYSPYRFMRAERIPSDGVVATRCQTQPTRLKSPETVVCEANSDTVLLPKITQKMKLPSPPLSLLRQSASEATSALTPAPAVERRSPLSALGVNQTLSPDASPSKSGPHGSGLGPPAHFETLQEIAALRGHRGWVKTVAFTADREMIVSGGQDGTIRLWRFGRGGPPEQAIPHLHSGGVQALALTPDGKKLASTAIKPEGIVRLWDMSSAKAKLRALFQVPKAPAEALAFSPNGNLLAIGSGNAILLWNLSKPALKEDCALRGHAETIKALVFTADGSTLASASQDGTVRLWTTDLPAARELAKLESAQAGVMSLGLARDGQTVAWGGQDHTVSLWETNGAQPKKRAVLQGHGGAVRLVLFPTDDQTILSVDDKNCAILWDLASLAKIRQWLLPGGTTVASVAGTSDGRYLATGSMGIVTVFRLYPKDKSSPAK